MLKVGVTGGIGSGKSVICRIFAILGAPVYNADYRAAIIMESDPRVIQKIREEYGSGVFRGSKPDRKALADIVFNNRAALDRLNGIIHPEVRRDFSDWVNKHKSSPYVIKEAAILFETGTYRELDQVILVTAPEEIRIRRVAARDGVTEDSIRKRMDRQWTDKRKEELAGVVIRNDNLNPVLDVITRLHNDYSAGVIAGRMLNE